ncbi:hypothetical protein [Mesorhizobium neociceri]|uniref:Uncharacterized protein n=1 Tax=Mesorhizobium neociceri TaxID=1307853 RepID=A0A838BEL0_9HYPH|nr:hypothetical protein [Mesorhizobium neociceri]MBA1144752.1 hypothetical protein [Mesorhizobium neociceri]
MRTRWLQWIGLGVAPLAWALSTELSQITPYIDCRQNIPWSAVFCGATLFVSVAGIAAARAVSPGRVQTKRFVVDVGFLIALAFVFALLLQEAATMLLDACQR